MDPEQLLTIRNFGPRSFLELREKLAEFGFLPEGAVMSAVMMAGEFADDPATLDLRGERSRLSWTTAHCSTRRSRAMRHRNAGRKLGRNSSQRQALLRQLAISMILHERITTTEAKAK